MGGRSVTPTLTALLCLGLCQGPWDQVQAGDVPKPSIWADPGPIITNRSSVTIWCQGSLQASAYLLYKERGSEPLDTRIPQNSSNKAGFLIKAMTSSYAGLYECEYYTTGNISSHRSEPLLLVVTGVGSAPSLSAQPSPVVASGENVSLSCSSNHTSGPFHLLKEGEADSPRCMEAQLRTYAGRQQAQAIFPLGPVSASHGGTYRCYGSSSSYPNVWSHPSEPLELVVSGLKWYLIVLIGVSVALVLLLSLFLFLLLQHRQRQGKGRTSAPGEGSWGLEAHPTFLQWLQRQSKRTEACRRAAEVQEESLYAVTKDTQAEQDRQLDSQADDLQDVTYAQLQPSTLSQEASAAPSAPPEASPEERSVYAALAMH